MQILKFKNYEELSNFTAGIIFSAIQANPSLVLCLASGSTPGLTCDLLVNRIKEAPIDCSQLSFIGLDEWVGLPATCLGSCQHFFRTKLFGPLQLKATQYHLFNALANDLQAECATMDRIIDEKGGIDLMLVGIGMNGHIGFNEPGTSFSSLSHVAELDELTKTIGQRKYFAEPVTLDRGITIGLGHLLNTKKVVLIANGTAKADVIQRTVQGPVTERFPASIMQHHENGFVVLDEDAACLLNK